MTNTSVLPKITVEDLAFDLVMIECNSEFVYFHSQNKVDAINSCQTKQNVVV